LLNSRLHDQLGPSFNANLGLDPNLRSRLSPETLESFQAALASSLQAVFVVCALLTLLGLGIGLLFPRGSATEHAHREMVAEPL
jgi:hypothetical protein